jgi:hypothetical protein
LPQIPQPFCLQRRHVGYTDFGTFGLANSIRHRFCVFERVSGDGEVTSSRRSSRWQSGVDHSQVCRLLLEGQMARAGEAWSCTSPQADVTRVAIPRRPCRLLLPMPTLLTAYTWGTGHVTCRPRWGATRAEMRGHRHLGRLPMRNGSRQSKAQPCESANACISNICHTAPANERPPCAETVCGIVYRANYISLSILHIKHVSPPLCFLQRPPCCLWSSRSFRAKTNDPLAVMVLPGLFARLA